MSKENRHEGWAKEFNHFLASDSQAVPERLSQTVLSKVRTSLHPSMALVFFRLVVVHLFAGSATLFVCPQFGVGPIGGWLDLMSVVMPAGPIICAIFCGTLYLGMTAVASHLVLSPEMLRVLEKTRYRQFALLAALSLGGFMLLSGLLAQGFPSVGMVFVSFWFLGGVLLSQGLFHLFFRLRKLAL